MIATTANSSYSRGVRLRGWPQDVPPMCAYIRFTEKEQQWKYYHLPVPRYQKALHHSYIYHQYQPGCSPGGMIKADNKAAEQQHQNFLVLPLVISFKLICGTGLFLITMIYSMYITQCYCMFSAARTITGMIYRCQLIETISILFAPWRT